MIGDAAFFFILAFAGTGVEIYFASFGIIFPAAAIALFYMSCISGWPTGLVSAFLCGIFLDAVFARDIPCAAPALLPIPLMAYLWIEKGETRSAAAQFIPGMLCGAVYACILTASSSIAQSPMQMNGLLWLLSQIFLSTLAGGIALAATVWIFDIGGAFFGIEQFRNMKKKHSETN